MDTTAVQKRSLLSLICKGYDWLGEAWDSTLHPLFHYGVIPALFAVGLYQTGELTMDPLTLFQKIILS